MKGARMFGLAMVLASAACTSGGVSPAQRAASRSEPNRITATEMSGATQQNLLDYIKMARPRWLESQRTTSFEGRTTSVLVYVDGQRFGDAGQLRTMALRGVKEIRYYSASEAAQRFNTTTLGSIINVVTK